MTRRVTDGDGPSAPPPLLATRLHVCLERAPALGSAHPAGGNPGFSSINPRWILLHRTENLSRPIQFNAYDDEEPVSCVRGYRASQGIRWFLRLSRRSRSSINESHFRSSVYVSYASHVLDDISLDIIYSDIIMFPSQGIGSSRQHCLYLLVSYG